MAPVPGGLGARGATGLRSHHLSPVTTISPVSPGRFLPAKECENDHPNLESNSNPKPVHGKLSTSVNRTFQHRHDPKIDQDPERVGKIIIEDGNARDSPDLSADAVSPLPLRPNIHPHHDSHLQPRQAQRPNPIPPTGKPERWAERALGWDADPALWNGGVAPACRAFILLTAVCRGDRGRPWRLTP